MGAFYLLIGFAIAALIIAVVYLLKRLARLEKKLEKRHRFQRAINKFLVEESMEEGKADKDQKMIIYSN